MSRERCERCDMPLASVGGPEATHKPFCECPICKTLCWNGFGDNACTGHPVNWRKRALLYKDIMLACALPLEVLRTLIQDGWMSPGLAEEVIQATDQVRLAIGFRNLGIKPDED